ncbi:hypothetical protein VTL71DRAFT_15626 [Oculimacula yallundae]|uniref:Cytochrome P450 n=1 Tax=Oculimacula yallundae TaxID=86028 RepID=A0ABR4CH51_9HELO
MVVSSSQTFIDTIGRWGTRPYYLPTLVERLPPHKLALPEDERRYTLQNWLVECLVSSPDQDSSMKASDPRDLILSLLGMLFEVSQFTILGLRRKCFKNDISRITYAMEDGCFDPGLNSAAAELLPSILLEVYITSGQTREPIPWGREGAMWDRNLGYETVYRGKVGKDVLLRTLTFDRMANWSGSARMTQECLLESIGNMKLKAEQYYSPPHQRPDRDTYFAIVNSFAFRRWPFTTKFGFVGIGRESVKPGVMITLLCGANVPFDF